MWYNYIQYQHTRGIGGSRALTGAGIRVGELTVGGRAYGDTGEQSASGGQRHLPMQHAKYSTEPRLNAGLVFPCRIYSAWSRVKLLVPLFG
jgi:hypothetical protein